MRIQRVAPIIAPVAPIVRVEKDPMREAYVMAEVAPKRRSYADASASEGYADTVASVWNANRLDTYA